MVDFQACEESESGSGRKEVEESGGPIDAKNILLMPSGEKVVIWTRSEPKAHQTHTHKQPFDCEKYYD